MIRDEHISLRHVHIFAADCTYHEDSLAGVSFEDASSFIGAW